MDKQNQKQTLESNILFIIIIEMQRDKERVYQFESGSEWGWEVKDCRRDSSHWRTVKQESSRIWDKESGEPKWIWEEEICEKDPVK